MQKINRFFIVLSVWGVLLSWLILSAPFCYSQDIQVGSLAVTLTYKGQPPSATSSSGGFSISLDNYSLGPISFLDNFTANNIPVGDYTLHLNKSMSPIISPNDLLPPVPVSIGAGQTTQVNFDVTNVMGIVKGRVMINGQPASALFVNASVNCGTMGCEGNASATTGTDGSFRLMLPVGPGSGTVRSMMGSSLASFAFTVTAGTETDVGTVNVETGSLAVTLTYKGQPPSATSSSGGFSISLDNYSLGPISFLDNFTTNNIPVGDYTLHLNKSMSPIISPNDLLPPVSVSIGAGQTTQVNFDVTNVVGIVKGRVMINGQPASGLFVNASVNCGIMGCEGNASATIGTDGSFRLMLPVGPGSGTVRSMMGSSLASFAFTVTAGTETDVGTVNVETGSLAVTLTYKGQPPSATSSSGGFSISLDNYSLGPISFLDNFTANNIPVGDYTLHLNKSMSPIISPNDLLPPVPVSIGAGQTTQVNFDVTNVVGIVKGRVTINGQPASALFVNASVNCGTMGCEGNASATTGTDGSFRLMLPVGPGSGTVRSMMGSSLASFAFMVTAGTETDVGNQYINLNLLSPVAGATLYKGTTYKIRWSWANYSGNIRIYLYKNGSYYQTMAASEPVTNGAIGIDFIPPITWDSGSQYEIQISTLDGLASSKSGLFTITNPMPIVGSIHGTLHNKSATGPPISDATVSCGGQNTLTKFDGSYILTNVPKGTQILNFSKVGFIPYSEPIVILGGIDLDAGSNYLTKKTEGPVITYFTINNGVGKTISRAVTLNNLATGDPSQYIASESPDFRDSSWLPYSKCTDIYFKCRRWDQNSLFYGSK